MSNARTARGTAFEAARLRARARSEAGYGVIGYLVIAAVVLAIIAGGILLVTMVTSSVTTQEPAASPTPSSIGQCPADTVFDSASATCIPKAVCAEGEEYRESTNTCVVPPPVVRAVSPSSGLLTGGTAIEITGSGFASDASVQIDGVPADDVVVESDELITATTPGSENLYPVDIVVQNPEGPPALLDNAFTYDPLPVERATEVIPAKGSKDGKEAVIIKGRGFVDGVVVAFGGRAATDVIVLDRETLRVTTPVGQVGPATVNVRLPGEDAYLLEDAFAYANQPRRAVLSVRPVKGPQSGGTKITVVGTGFAKGATVTVGKKRAAKVKVVSTTRITAVTPAGPLGKVTVGVRNPGMPAAFLEKAFTYLEAPTITGVKPLKGPAAGGTKVTVTGTGFLAAAKVEFGGTPAKKVKVVNPTTITMETPKGKKGPVAVTVENPGQPIATLKKGFTYVANPKPDPEPEASTPSTPTRPSAPALPRCQPVDITKTAGAGADLVLDSGTLFPSSVRQPELTAARFVPFTSKRVDGSILWQDAPAAIFWQAPSESGRGGTILFTYRAASCSGSGAGTVTVSTS